jgi:hypothetical protein
VMPYRASPERSRHHPEGTISSGTWLWQARVESSARMATARSLLAETTAGNRGLSSRDLDLGNPFGDYGRVGAGIRPRPDTQERGRRRSWCR